MTLAYPNDADGDALRRVQADGSDMSQPMDIDFAVAVPSPEAGDAVARVAGALLYATKVVRDAGGDDADDTPSWTCYCTRRMIPDYAALISVQAELDAIGRPFGGYIDGWGTFGNVAHC